MELEFLPIFENFTEAERTQLLSCGAVYEKSFARGQTVLHCGERTDALGVVLMGAVNIESNDLWGSRSILGRAEEGELFAETYALCGRVLMVDAVAAQPSRIAFFQLGRLLDANASGEGWQKKLLRALLLLTAEKNLALSDRIFCTTPKSLRARLLTYLSQQARLHGARSFSIPFDRQQLADFLNVDRSALSKELGRMRDEGLLETSKNRFTLLDITEE